MDFMLALAGILLLAILFLYISQVFKIPSIVSFLVIGMLAGPYGLGLITDKTGHEACDDDKRRAPETTPISAAGSG
jgi:CPA2 family monovalent cation:H+ antiporter-2